MLTIDMMGRTIHRGANTMRGFHFRPQIAHTRIAVNAEDEMKNEPLDLTVTSDSWFRRTSE